jgi:hypothetical protein
MVVEYPFEPGISDATWTVASLNQTKTQHESLRVEWTLNKTEHESNQATTTLWEWMDAKRKLNMNQNQATTTSVRVKWASNQRSTWIKPSKGYKYESWIDAKPKLNMILSPQRLPTTVKSTVKSATPVLVAAVSLFEFPKRAASPIIPAPRTLETHANEMTVKDHMCMRWKIIPAPLGCERLRDRSRSSACHNTMPPHH